MINTSEIMDLVAQVKDYDADAHVSEEGYEARS